jgi:phosphate starvation-inducible PhoH-like protein
VSSKTKPFGEPILYDAYGKPVHAKTQGQYELVQAIDKFDILFVNGPSGTGKTFLSICKAVQYIDDKKYKKLILTRPAVESGEELGALPGDIDDKITPYMKPLYQSLEKLKKKKPKPKNLEEIANNGNNKKKKATKKTVVKRNAEDKYIENFYKKVEISPLAYMRGLSFENTFILADECQNMTSEQMKMFLTRLGVGSKVILTGDASQSDLIRRNVRSGFAHAQKLLNGVKGIGFITLDENDIVRHRLVKDIILKYENERRTDTI